MEIGRPVYWEGEVKNKAIEIVLNRIEEGESVRSILDTNRDKEKLPSRRVFNKWLSEDESLSTQYAYATDVRADSMFEDILDIADESQSDTYLDKEDIERTNHEVIARSRLRVDARKWYLSKLKPKKYGDKLETTIQGGDKPVNIVSLGSGIKPK